MLVRIAVIAFGLWFAIILIGVVAAIFTPTTKLIELHRFTDHWMLRPLDDFIIWVVEARQYRDLDG